MATNVVMPALGYDMTHGAVARWLKKEGDAVKQGEAIAEVVESIDEEGNVFEELSLRGCVATLDGSDVIRASGIGAPERARELGLSVAAELFELGARDLLDQRTTERE